MKKIAVVGTLCILIGIALAGCIDYSDEAPEKTIERDSDFDGWTDTEEREAHTNPFDVDTDHDGIWDPEDPNPSRIGILINPEEKLEAGEYLEFDLASAPGWVGKKPCIVTRDDIILPKESSLLTTKIEIPSGYACYRSYHSYEINASSTQAIDFFLVYMQYNGWHTCNATDQFCDAPYQFELYNGIYGMYIQFFKRGDQDTYVTILVMGEEEYPYSQFMIIKEDVD